MLIVTSLYNLCLLITAKKEVFRVVGMQTDNTLFLGLKEFATLKDKELRKAKLTAKLRDILSPKSRLIFNRYVLSIDSDDTIYLI